MKTYQQVPWVQPIREALQNRIRVSPWAVCNNCGSSVRKRRSQSLSFQGDTDTCLS